MGMIVGICPKCGAKVKEKCNAWVYGSPIRTCPKCNMEYLDTRWREVAVDGFAKGSKNAKLYFIATLGFLLFSVLCILRLIYVQKTDSYYSSELIGCIIVGFVGVLGCGLIFLRIVTGYEDKKNAIFMEESKKRLQDKNYVEKLVIYGYKIPDEFRR